jgi:hypothetical protein
VDPLHDENTVLVFDLARGLADQSSVARIDVTRLQRAPEGAGESAGRGGDEIVERGRPLGLAASRDSVVIGDLVVHAELDLGERKLGAA